MIVLLVHVKPHTARNSSMRISAANTVSGCALEDIGVVSRDAFALPTNRSSVVCCSLWLVCSHTAGRVWGACRVQPDLHRVAALTWLDKPFGPTHPDVGCMTARRCAKVLAGGFQVSWLACCEGWHVGSCEYVCIYKHEYMYCTYVSICNTFVYVYMYIR